MSIGVFLFGCAGNGGPQNISDQNTTQNLTTLFSCPPNAKQISIGQNITNGSCTVTLTGIAKRNDSDEFEAKLRLSCIGIKDEEFSQARGGLFALYRGGYSITVSVCEVSGGTAQWAKLRLSVSTQQPVTCPPDAEQITIGQNITKDNCTITLTNVTNVTASDGNTTTKADLNMSCPGTKEYAFKQSEGLKYFMFGSAASSYGVTTYICEINGEAPEPWAKLSILNVTKGR